MKTQITSIALIISLFMGQAAFAADSVKPAQSNAIETITVISTPEPAFFEVYSLQHAEDAIDSVLETMAASYTAVKQTANLVELATNIGS